jgi:preprotein translocase subunit YajC
MIDLVPTAPPGPLVAAAECLTQFVVPGWHYLLAQGGAAADRPELPFVMQYLPLVAIAAVAYMLLFRPERERMRKQQELLSALKKNDRVVTSAGIYGTVANVERESDRVTLKVDDASNAKLTVTLSSISRVLRDGESAGAGGS